MSVSYRLRRRLLCIRVEAREDAGDGLEGLVVMKHLENTHAAEVQVVPEFLLVHRAILHDPLHDVVDEGDLLLVVERSIEELGEGGACSLLREPCERTDKYPEGGGRRLIIRTRSPRAKTEYT